MQPRIILLFRLHQSKIGKECDNMIKINYLSTLFVGIDVSSKSNVVYAMDFVENKFISSSFSNNQPGADELVGMIHDCMVHQPNLKPYAYCLILRQRLITASLMWQWRNASVE